MSLYSSLTQVLAPFAAKINGLLTGWDGTRYNTPGEAVRQQIADLHVLIGDEPGTAISASAISYGDSDVGTELTNVNGRLDEQGEDILELQNGGYIADQQQIGAKINAWLNDHPEATTTVEDGSITEAKFTDALKLKTVNGYVTPEMFGAKGDGTIDDAAAFESAFASGLPVLAGAKTYYISRALSNPGKITLCGCGKKITSIKLGDSLFANAISNSTISDIYFYCDNSSENTFYVFPGEISTSRIRNCEFRYFDKIFQRVKTCTRIEGNHFAFIKTLFCATLIDSFVVNNYINAPKHKNPQTIAFSSTVTHSTIQGNFFDYWYRVFSVKDSMHEVSVTGNIFDVCYCIFYNHIENVTFVGNTISNMKKQSDWDVSENSDMNEKHWAVMKRVAGTDVPIIWANAVLANNSLESAIDMYMDCESVSRYPTYDLTIDEFIDASKFNFGAYKSGVSADLKNISIRPMLKRTVTALPNAALTGNAVSFNHDEVIYNGDLYINIDGAWKQLTS